MGRRGWAATLLWIATSCGAFAGAELPLSTFQLIQAHPHDMRIFTQGLALESGRLYQSSGLRGQSRVVVGAAGSASVDASFHFPNRYFAEGLTIVDQELLVLTWKAGEMFVFDKTTLVLKNKRRYPGEGWGLAYDGEAVWLSDGSSVISRYAPQTMKFIGSITVRDGNGRVQQINELEWANGVLLANIWNSPRLIAIDPASGRVIAEWNLASLLPEARNYGHESVANGIAFDPDSGHFWLTGKGWSSIYEVVLHGLAGE